MRWHLFNTLLCAAVILSACESQPSEEAIGAEDVTLGDLSVDSAREASGCVMLGCDDGLSCTIDGCDEATGLCHWDLLPQTCILGGACVSDGAEHPTDDCLVCDSSLDTLAWTPVEGCVPSPSPGDEDGDPCDDEDVCTTDDRWSSGVCEGVPVECPDDGPCLTGVCDPADDVGCTLTPTDGPCEDGDACTLDDACSDGACVAGGPAVCEDDNPCTVDHCDTLAGCVHLPKQSPCCVGTESLCEDGNPCTDDSCDPLTAACDHVPNSEPCDDGDPCTEQSVCAEGECQGTPKTCDDSNPCTEDYCDQDGGCVHAPMNDVPCDDELECSTGDTCVAGVCEADTSQCICELAEGEMDGVQVTALALGQGGHPGEALDIDADPSTCAPLSDCSEGYNNALGLIATFANDALQEAVDSGDLLLAVSFDGAASGTFTLGVYQAVQVDADCDPSTTSCGLLVDPSSVETGTCAPLIQLPATVDGDQLQAGGPGFLFPFSLPLSEGADLDIVLHDTQVQGTITWTEDEVSAFSGVVGGAIPKTALSAAIANLPDEGLPVDKVLIEAVLSAVEADVDTDGDGEGDASSIGFKLTGVETEILGYGD